MPRVVLDREAYDERYAIMLEAGEHDSVAILGASNCAHNTPFARAATALANGDLEPAKEMCRREAERHGRERGVELMRALQEAVRESIT